MNVVYSFIGKMPNYVLDSVKQLRLFFDGPVYCIYSEISDTIRSSLLVHSVTLVSYDDVKSERFLEKKKRTNFQVVGPLGDRKLLFEKSYERLFLVHELMKKRSLKHVWAMEIDIMMYENPTILLNNLLPLPFCFHYQRLNEVNCSTCWIRDIDSIEPVLQELEDGNYGTEMSALGGFFAKNKDICLFPQIPSTLEMNPYTKDFVKFDGWLFDGAALGIYACGWDPYHTEGRIVLDKQKIIQKMGSRFVNLWKYGTIEWIKNSKGYLVPIYKTEEKEYPIFNLHIHCKDLQSASSTR